MTFQETGERLVQVAREAVDLIEELTAAGKSPQEIKTAVADTEKAKSIIEHVAWRIREPEDRAIWLHAMRTAIEFLENHVDPRTDVKEAFVVEDFADDIMDRYLSLVAYNQSNEKPRWTLSQFASSYVGAASQMEEDIAKGLVCVGKAENKRSREYNGKLLTPTECLPHKVSRRGYEKYDVERYANAIRQKVEEEVA